MSPANSKHRLFASLNSASAYRVHQDRHFVSVEPVVFLGMTALTGLVFVPVLGRWGALIFLVAGMAAVLRHWRSQVHLCKTYWPVILLPTFCLVSTIWSEFPAISFRLGLQFMATVIIAVTIAATTPARVFCQTLFGLYSLAMLASVLVGDVRNDTGAWLGVYGSKNALAGAAAVYVMICLVQIFDGSASLMRRLLAALGLVMGIMLLLLAQSVSALAIIPPALFILFSLMILIRLTQIQRIIGLVFMVLFAALFVILVMIFAELLLALMLETTGKDMTLTGRTELWGVALEFIAERPLLGIGYQAFWVHGHSPAETLWAAFGIDGRSGFNFHNTYLSNMVEIGIVGVALQVVVLFGAAVLSGIWALRTHQSEALLLFILVIMVVMVSFVEVPVFFQFSLRSFMVICTFVYALRGLEAHRQSL